MRIGGSPKLGFIYYVKTYIKMELLYFISGILSVGVVYGITLLRTVKSSHTDLLERHQSYQNISSLRMEDLVNELNDLKLLILDIQSNMEKDQYASVAELNKQISELGELANSTNSRLGESNKVFTKNISDVFSEIQQLKNNLKALGQDPNFLSRY